MTGSELGYARLVIGPFTTLVRKIWASAPGAHSVQDPVRMGGILPPRGGKHELSSKDLQKLSEKLTLRLTEENREYALLGYEEGEKILLALNRTLSRELTMSDVQAGHLIASNIKGMLEKQAPEAAGELGRGKDLYDKLLQLCCEHIVEFFTQRPEFAPRTLMEIRAGQAELVSLLDVSRGDTEFESRFCETSAVRIEKAQLLGAVDIRPEERSYDLTTAYVSLIVEADPPIQPSREWHTSGISGSFRAPFEEVLKYFPCLLLEGPAGSGKTTLIQNLAVHAMRGELPQELTHWKGRVPFFLKLRSFVKGGRIDLPTPERFVGASGSNLEGEKPSGWVARLLKTGRSIVLIDGVDEVPAGLRDEVFEWIRGLRIDYPKPTYIVTSRPNVLNDEWRHELNRLEFGAAQLQAMTRPQVNHFIKRWHEAQNPLPDEDLEACRSRLADAFDTRRDLARLATNPLLCALMCALHRSNYDLPEGRTQLYKSAIAMMLGGREKAAAIPRGEVTLLPEQQEKILSQLALWMTLNGQRSMPESVALRQLEENVMPLIKPRLRSADEAALTAKSVLSYVVERSGFLRSPEVGVLEFRHASFQDYLAGLEILRNDSLPHLLRLASDPLYHDVIIMTVGRTQNDQRLQSTILKGLIERAEDSAEDQRLWLLAAACVADVGMVDPEISDLITEKTRDLLPPQTDEGIRNVAGAGEFVLDLLADVVQRKQLDESGARAVASIASHFPGDAGIPLLNRMGSRPEPSVRQVVADTWHTCSDPSTFLNEILLNMKLDDLVIAPPSVDLLVRLLENSPIHTLRLDGPQFDEIPTAHLAAHTSIKRLVLSNNSWELSPLVDLPNISTLLISRGHVTFGTLRSATHVKSLHMSDCDTNLRGLPKGLTELTISAMVVERGEIESLARLEYLRNLRLDYTTHPEIGGRVSPLDLNALRVLPEIEHLEIVRTSTTNMYAVKNLPKLQKFVIDEEAASVWREIFSDKPHILHVLATQSEWTSKRWPASLRPRIDER